MHHVPVVRHGDHAACKRISPAALALTFNFSASPSTKRILDMLTTLRYLNERPVHLLVRLGRSCSLGLSVRHASASNTLPLAPTRRRV